MIRRRRFLRGAALAVATPALHSLLPRALWAAEPTPALRLCWVFVPNGMQMAAWTPKTVGDKFKLSPTLASLAAHRDDVLVLSGLTINGGRALGDGPGDHARAASSYLTCAHPKKTGGAGLRAGESVDQVAARHLGATTRFASVELGCERGARSGQCDSGYSCAYSSAISWRTPTTPNAKETRPRQVFDRLFLSTREGESPQDSARRLTTRRSVLDFVLEDAAALRSKLGSTDAQKLDEYLTGVREIERRLQSLESSTDSDAGDPLAGLAMGTPKSFAEHQQLMYDLIALAFQADITRVATFMVGNAGSPRTFAPIGVRDPWHPLSHHGGDKSKNERIAKIDRFNVEQLAHFVGRLAAIDDPVTPGKRLLDSTIVTYGSGIGDGNRHNHDDLPIVVVGSGHGSVRTGRHIRLRKNTPTANLYLSQLQAAGLSREVFADSTVPLVLT